MIDLSPKFSLPLDARQLAKDLLGTLPYKKKASKPKAAKEAK